MGLKSNGRVNLKKRRKKRRRTMCTHTRDLDKYLPKMSFMGALCSRPRPLSTDPGCDLLILSVLTGGACSGLLCDGVTACACRLTKSGKVSDQGSQVMELGKMTYPGAWLIKDVGKQGRHEGRVADKWMKVGSKRADWGSCDRGLQVRIKGQPHDTTGGD